MWSWEHAVAGAVAAFATIASLHPLDVVRTRFQVNDGRSSFPSYKNTAHALVSIARNEGPRGLYVGFIPTVLGSTISWGLYFLFYNGAKNRYLKDGNDQHSTGYYMLSAMEAGCLVSVCTNPIWLIKTRLQLQAPSHHRRPYAGFSDALRTILREEGKRALYRGLGPSLFLVSHGAIQFTVYEELRNILMELKGKKTVAECGNDTMLLSSFDYAVLGASSKSFAMLCTYPFQVIRSRMQQRPHNNGTQKYLDSWHVLKETARYEGVRGFYRGLTASMLKNLPAASLTFVVYENVLSLLYLLQTPQ